MLDTDRRGVTIVLSKQSKIELHLKKYKSTSVVNLDFQYKKKFTFFFKLTEIHILVCHSTFLDVIMYGSFIKMKCIIYFKST